MTIQLVFVRNGQAFTTSKVIASGAEITHHAVIQLIRTHQTDFETFGVLAFEMTKPTSPQGGRPETIALLNEQQATLLVTYCKNTRIVRKFKVALVKAFYDMRQQLMSTNGNNLSQQVPLSPWQQYKIQRAVAERAKGSHVHFNTIYKAIKIYFKVAKYDQIPVSRFDECINFIQTVDLRIPEVLSDQPVEFPKPQLPSCPHCELVARGNLQQASVKDIQQLSIDARNALSEMERERIRAWTCLHEIVFKLKAFV